MTDDESWRGKIVTFKSEDFWLKVVGMLQQNWALIDIRDGAVVVIFFDDLNQVFDQLSFDEPDAAETALKRNGFGRYDDNKQAKEFIAKPANSFRISCNQMRPIYSSGEYWI